MQIKVLYIEDKCWEGRKQVYWVNQLEILQKGNKYSITFVDLKRNNNYLIFIFSKVAAEQIQVQY